MIRWLGRLIQAKPSPALSYRDFRLLMLGRLAVVMSWQVQAIGVSWFVYDLTKSPYMLGMIGLTEAIPAIGGSLFSGHIVDQSRPYVILLMSTVVQLVFCLMLFVGIQPEMPVSSDALLILLFAGIFVSGAVRSFATPSVFSLISKTVPKELFASASAFSASTFQFAMVVGPAIGGFVYGWAGRGSAFALPVILVTLGGISWRAMGPGAHTFASGIQREKFVPSFINGLRFAFEKPVLLTAMTLDMFSVLFGGAVAVLPIFADQIFHVGPEGLGILRAAPSIGSVIVGLFLALYPLKVMTGRLLLWMVAGFGVCTLGFALSTHFWLGLFFLGFAGAFDGVSMVIRQTILQVLTPDSMRGRLSALNSVFVTSSNEIGAFESGVAAQVMGLVPSVVFGGIMTLLIVSGVAIFSKSLKETRISLHE